MAVKSNGKRETYQIKGRPEVYDDIVQVLRRASKLGGGTEVLLAVVPSLTTKKASLE